MNFAEYSTYWTDTILTMKKPASQASMKSHIRRAVRSFGDFDLSELTESAVQKHIFETSKELSPKSLQSYWGTIRLVLSRARKEGLILAVPEPELPKIFKTKQPCFTAEEMKKVIQNSDGQYKLLFHLLSETGVRAGEAFALKPSDIDFEKETLNITRSVFNGKIQDPKTENAVRTISISGRLAGWCADSNRDYLFGATRTENPSVSKSLAVLHRNLNEVGLSKTGFHAFRRGNATLQAEIGVPEYIIRMRLGHSGGVTAGYIQVPTGADKEWAEKIAEKLC